MTNKTHFLPAFEEGHFYGLVDEGKYLRQSSLYKQILPIPVRRSFSEGGTPSRPKTSMIPVAKNLFTPLETCLLFLMGRNLRLINDLRLCNGFYICRASSTDVMSALQIHLFMQNKAKFKKVKSNLNKEITTDYEQMDTWSRGTKQSQTNPNKAKTNPILANKTPIQTQFKPKQTQFQRQRMLCSRINTRCESLGYYPEWRFFAGQIPGRRQEFLAALLKLDLIFLETTFNMKVLSK
jgi:hypothetical protein